MRFHDGGCTNLGLSLDAIVWASATQPAGMTGMHKTMLPSAAIFLGVDNTNRSLRWEGSGRRAGTQAVEAQSIWLMASEGASSAIRRSGAGTALLVRRDGRKMDSNGHEWIEIPGGYSCMGSDESDPYAGDYEKPLREVYIPLNPGMSPNLDMGIDSLAWLQLVLEMEQALAVTFDEAAKQTPLTIGEFLQKLVSSPSDATQRPPSTELGQLKPSPQQMDWLARRGALHRFANAALHAIIRGTMRSLFGFRVAGLDNLPPSGSFILCANHLSDLDALVLPTAMPFGLVGRMHFAAAATRLFTSPLTRVLCNIAHVYPIDDRNPGPALALALEVLRRGGVQTWFPEMWRSADGMSQPFLRGIGVLAKEANVPIVPVAIQGTFELMPRWRRYPGLGRINVTVGPALYPDQLSAAGHGDDAYSSITNTIALKHSKLIADAM